MPTIPRILAYDRIMTSFTHSLNSMNVVLPFSHTHSIHRSHFAWFCSISAFDGRSLVAFRLRILTRCPCLPFSRTIAFFKKFFFYSFRSLSAFNGDILPGFAQSLHSTVAFWQLFLSPHSPTPHLSPILAYDRIFAAFAHSQHLTVVF